MTLESSNLTRNQQTVLNILEKSTEPLKAYAILFDIQKKGIKSPLQVYRALDKLIEIGKIHRVESQNSFVACKVSDCDTPHKTIFSICNSCEIVSEIKDSKLFKQLKDFSDNDGIKFDGYNLEFFGTCKACKNKQPESTQY